MKEFTNRWTYAIILWGIVIVGILNPEYKETLLIFTGFVLIAYEINAMRAR